MDQLMKSVEAVEPNDSAGAGDPRDEKLRIWKFSLPKPRLANAHTVLRIKAEMENRRRTEQQDIESA